MPRLVLIGLLVLAVICMVPLMGAEHVTAGHLHHGAAVSCATCIGPESIVGDFFLLSLLGIAMLILPAVPPLPPLQVQFPVPRAR
jgi:hypothetical protein